MGLRNFALIIKKGGKNLEDSLLIGNKGTPNTTII